MSCVNGQCYLPQPPRAWSRVQNSCTFENGSDTNTNANTLVQLPYSTKQVPASSLGQEIAMINKGNVLQYKINSSSLTQNQRYSKIAKGQWTNRTKTFASQSTRGYTNPNTQSLMRVGGSNVTITGQPTDFPVTCPINIRPVNRVLPLQVSNTNNNQVLPPPPPPPPGGTGNVMPMVPVPIVEPVVIQDFGNLVCGTKEDLCTGLLIMPIQLDNCHPTTDSDVPGQIQDLCWNDGNPTWYPRQQYLMTNSANKWPVNAPLLSAVKPATPVLTLTIASGVNTLSWITTTVCLPISSYNVYQNNLLIANTTNLNYNVVFNNTLVNEFYVISLSGTIESNPSNIVIQK